MISFEHTKDKEYTIKGLNKQGELISHTFRITEDENPSDYFELGEILHEFVSFREKLV